MTPSLPSLPAGPRPIALPGDAPSFRVLRERHAAEVERWIRLSGVPERDRPDVAQETWLRVERALGNLDPRRPVEPWLCTIARHAACDHLSLSHVRHEVLVYAEGEPFPEVEAHAQRRLDAEAVLARAGAELPDEEWQVFVLVEIEEQTCPAIAEALGVPEGTVRSRLFRARRRLAAIRERLEAGGRKRTRMVAAPALLLGWREGWSRLARWLRSRFALGAVTGGAAMYLLLRPAPPVPAPPIVEVPAVSAESARAVGPAMPPVLSAHTRAGDVDERVKGAPAGTAATGSGTAGGSKTASGAGIGAQAGTAPGEEERAERSALLAMEAAQALIRHGRCEEAGRTLDPHAARLARGPLAPEYRELRRRAQACTR